MQHVLILLSASLLSISIVYNIMGTWLVLNFKKRHRTNRVTSLPKAHVLKPMHQADSSIYPALESLCLQQVPPTEIRFGVDDEKDSSIAIIKKLKETFPSIPMQLVIASTKSAPNRKMLNLAHLAHDVSEPIIIAIDQDILLEPDHLEKILSPFLDERVGLVTSLYRISSPTTLGLALEALSVHTQFFPAVLIGEYLEKGLSFAFGATIAIRREVLEKIGGFDGLTEYLADDHELGARVRKAGYDVVLSDSIVTHIPGAVTFLEYWKRSIRAARTHRICRPLGYFLSVLTQGFPWIILLLLLDGPSHVFMFLTMGWSLMRLLNALMSHEILRKTSEKKWLLFLLPMSEFFHFIFWVAAFTGNEVTWGGTHYRVYSDGRMKALKKPCSGGGLETSLKN